MTHIFGGEWRYEKKRLIMLRESSNKVDIWQYLAREEKFLEWGRRVTLRCCCHTLRQSQCPPFLDTDTKLTCFPVSYVLLSNFSGINQGRLGAIVDASRKDNFDTKKFFDGIYYVIWHLELLGGHQLNGTPCTCSNFAAIKASLCPRTGYKDTSPPSTHTHSQNWPKPTLRPLWRLV